MKIKIEKDMFDIVERIKEIDDGYFIVFDDEKTRFEVHNSKQEFTYCLTIPFDVLDSRVIDLINSTFIGISDNILEYIDKNNEKIEENNRNCVKSQADFMAREIYDFCNNSSKKFDENSFHTMWR